MKKYVVGKPNIVDKEKFLTRVEDILDSGVLTNNGKYVLELESRVAQYHNTAHAIAFCNATLALECVLSTIPPGEILLPAFTFIATAQAVKRAGHKPIFIDVAPDSFGMDPDKTIVKMTKQTRGILPVNLFGHTCQLKELNNLGTWYDVPVIYDSAHGMGMTDLGGQGLCEVFSLHATKICNSIEGGIVTTDNTQLAKKLKSIRNFGYSHESGLPPEGIFYNPYLATNAKMSEIHAAMGLTNFEQINELKSKYWTSFQTYAQELPPDVVLPVPNVTDSNFSYIPIMVNNRDILVNYLRENGIMARKYFNYTCDQILGDPGKFPNSKLLMSKIACLPTGLDITVEDVKFICSTIKEGLKIL
jgi:dTDP-4-amino-4,6-dideoxygalactose transaminase